MDRKGHIRENELARIFNYDKQVGTEIDNLEAAVEKASKETDAENWEAVATEVNNVKSLLLAFEDKWNEREKQFRPLEA
jgi:ABC-type enterochelin transport system substrate-binding protein